MKLLAGVLLLGLMAAGHPLDEDYDGGMEGENDETIMDAKETGGIKESVGRPKQTADGGPLCSGCKCDEGPAGVLFVDCSEAYSLQDFPSWLANISLTQTGKDQDIELDLSYNQLSYLPEVPAAPVTLLDLSHNQINELELAALGNVADILITLDLSYNKLDASSIKTSELTGKKIEPFTQPLTLKSLSLSYNRLHHFDNDTFQNMKSLSHLDLSDNPLAELDNDTTSAIASITTLESLVLRNCGLSILPASLLAAMSELKSLDLSGNRFHYVPPALQGATSLVSLQLDNNIFHSLEANYFVGLDNLKNLSISYNVGLHFIEEGSFEPLEQLVNLRVAHNPQLSWISPAAWGKTKMLKEISLKELLLNNNKLKYLPSNMLNKFSNWKDIDVIDLQGNPWWCDCHNEWLITTLVPLLKEKTPQLTPDMTCHGPPQTSVIKESIVVVSELSSQEDLPCDNFEFSPWKHNFNLPSHGHAHDNQLDDVKARGNGLATAVGVICVLTILSTAALVTALYVQKKRNRSLGPVRYVKKSNRGRTQYRRPEGNINTVYRDEDDGVTIREMKTVRSWPPGEAQPPNRDA